MHKARWMSKILQYMQSKWTCSGRKYQTTLKVILLKYLNLCYCIFKTFKLPFDRSTKSITGVSPNTKILS